MTFKGNLRSLSVGLKKKVYADPYYNEVSEEIPEGFSLIESVEIREEIALTDPSHIRALFEMTPYAYRTGKEGRAAVYALNALTTDIHFRLFLYKKI